MSHCGKKVISKQPHLQRQRKLTQLVSNQQSIILNFGNVGQQSFGLQLLHLLGFRSMAVQQVRNVGIYHGLPAYSSDITGLTAIITGANGISGYYMYRVLSQDTKRWNKVHRYINPRSNGRTAF